MDPATIIIILAVVLGFYVAWNIGANDVANAIGTSVGSHALTLKRAVLIAAVFEFAGAFFLGSNVSETLESGIVNPAFFANDPRNFIYGMLASLLASGIWLQIASFFGWPVSTTHTIVGAVLGFGVVVGGFGTIHWDHLGSIIVSWVVSPLMGAGLSYLIFSMMRWKIFYHPSPIQATQKMTPYLVFIIFGVLTLIILFGGLKGLHFHLNIFQTLGLAIAVGVVSALIAAFLVRRIHTKQTPEELRRTHNMQLSIALNKAQKHLGRAEAASLGDLHEKVVSVLNEVNELCDIAESNKEVDIRPSEYKVVERVFAHLQIITACFMAFAHGANDVANAIGPFAAVIKAVSGPLQQVQNRVPTWMLMLGGVGIIMGLATWGWRVVETVGKKITELTPSRGFAAEFGAATTIVLASKLGLPISTTHTLVGAVLGVGFARGIEAINLNIVRDIIVSWVVTVPIGAALSVLFFYGFKAVLS